MVSPRLSLPGYGHQTALYAPKPFKTPVSPQRFGQTQKVSAKTATTPGFLPSALTKGLLAGIVGLGGMLSAASPAKAQDFFNIDPYQVQPYQQSPQPYTQPSISSTPKPPQRIARPAEPDWLSENWMSLGMAILALGGTGLLIWSYQDAQKKHDWRNRTGLPPSLNLGPRSPMSRNDAPDFTTLEMASDNSNVPSITLADVAGIPEVVKEVRKILTLYQKPAGKLQAKIPKGILLKGPPGTGKTLIAQAMAGELKCPIITRSGSDFVEMYVGVGASRIRAVFAEARKMAAQNALEINAKDTPQDQRMRGKCIVFIDEIDALGRTRTNDNHGNDERDQTLNALLVEMQGFNSKTEPNDVIVVAATNRDELLDPALLRPGRLGKHIDVTPPMTPKDREDVLKVHTKGVPLDKDVNTAEIARRMTPGISGAEIKNIVDEATNTAVIENRDTLNMNDFIQAIKVITLGLEKEGVIFSEKDIQQVAVHETLGHAAVARGVGLPIDTITVIPRSKALGLVKLDPEAFTGFLRRKSFLMQMAHMISGGRAAEEACFSPEDISGGAENDWERLNGMLKRAIAVENLFPERFGHVMISERNPMAVSDELKNKLDRVTDELIKEIYATTLAFIKAIPQEVREHLVKTVREKETIDRPEDINALFEAPIVQQKFKEAGYTGWQDLWQKIAKSEAQKRLSA